MKEKRVKATSKVSLSNNTDIHVGPTPPPFPVEGQQWLNTSTNPPQLYVWDGEKWVLQQIDVEKLDPDLIDDLKNDTLQKHQELLNEIEGINTSMDDLKKNVEERNEQDDAAFATVTQSIIDNRLEALGWYEENDGRISGIAQSMDGLVVRVGNAEKELTTLTLTASGLRSEVNAINNGTASVITQMSDRINLRVEKGSVISQISVEADKGVYIAGKAIYLDGTVKVADTFVAPRIISANSANTAYTKIEGQQMTCFGYFSNNWRGKTYAGNHSLEAKVGYIKMKQLDGGNTNALYYSAKGISTRMDADNNGSASGVIEFFADGYTSQANSLVLASSGNIILESTYNGGSGIYLNPNGAKVVVGDKLGNRYGIRSGSIDCTEVDATTVRCGEINSSGGTISTNASNFNFGNFYANATNINSKSEAVKIGGSTGNIVISGNMTCAKLVETSKRELKKNIKTYEGDALAIINSMRITEYQYLDDVEGVDRPYVGLILDEAPVEVADTKGEGVLVAQGTWLNSRAIQQLLHRVEELERKVA